MENLLAGFLTGAIGVELRERLDIAELPAECRKHVGVAEASGRPWTAWSTERGPMAAWVSITPNSPGIIMPTYSGSNGGLLRKFITLVGGASIPGGLATGPKAMADSGGDAI